LAFLNQFKIEFGAEGVDAGDRNAHGVAQAEGAAGAPTIECLGIRT
jgi:hypothetical protein